MNCHRCRCEVPADAGFCPDCGARLEAVCGGCGTANALSHKFCKKCGGSLAAGAARDATPAALRESHTPRYLAEKILGSRQSMAGERKQITVLFADVKGSMELLNDRDPEEARAILDPVLSQMMDAVHRYEGTVNQVMGDGIMALFGAPLAHEDHAVRACYAALRIQESVAQRAAEPRNGAAVRVRIGINSGEVVVRSVGSDLRMDYTAVGQTTHLAARMEQLAEPGAILITADCMRAAQGFIQTKARGPIPVKGMASPVEVFEVVDAGPVRTRLQAAAARGLTRFTGRDAVLARLNGALESARNGLGQVVSVVGEPGVGKSRLAHEFIRSAQARDWLVLETDAVSYGRATSYAPIVHLLRDYFKIEKRDGVEQIRSKVAASLADLDEALEPVRVPLLALLDVGVEDADWKALSPAQRRRLIFDALKRLMLRQAQAQPLLLVFEDLHAIDSESELLLRGFVDSIPALQVMMLATYRPEYQHPWGNKSYFTQLRLDPLSASGAEELLEALLGGEPALQQIRAMLIERTGGYPFYLEESVRTLFETGVIAGEAGAYRLAKDLEAARRQIPATVQAVLAARIDRLVPEEKWLLQSAAVIGREVPFSLLQELSDVDEETLHGMLENLQRAEFLYGTKLFPELEYSFKHALTQEVAYNALLQGTRRSLHARIVESIERSQGHRAADQVDQLAHHALRGELWGKAVGFLRQAGLTASARSANSEAVACVEQALEALGRLPETLETIAQGIDLRFDLHSALIPTGNFPRIVEILREAETLAERLGDARRLGRVAASMATWCWCVGDPDRALEYGQRALAIGQELKDEALESLANHRIGEAHVSLGNFRAAADSFSRNLERRASDSAPQRYGLAALQSVTSRAWLAWCLACMGEFAAAGEISDQCIRTAEAANHPYSLATTYAGAGERLRMQGEFAEAVTLLERASEICRRGGFGPLYMFVAPILGLAYLRVGRMEQGLQLLERVEQQAPSMNIVPFRVLALTYLADARLAAGRRAEALEAATRALEMLRTQRRPFAEPECLRVLGDIHASAEPPDATQAERLYREAIARAEGMELRPVLARCQLHLGRLYGSAGRREEALAQLERASTTLRKLGMAYWLDKCEAAIRRIREAAAGRAVAAGELFDPSLPEFQADPYPFYHRLRMEDPVHLTQSGFWVATRYDDVVTVLRDPRFGREEFGRIVGVVYGDDSERVPRPMVFRDPPAHTRLRSLVSKAFTSRVVEGMRPHIQDIVDRLLDRVQGASSMDIIADLAYPLPVTVICEMLGVPAQDAVPIRQWSADITGSLDALGLPSDREIVKRGRAARHALGEYFRSFLPEKRRHPKDDLLSRLIAAEDEGDRLSEAELLATCVLIFIAGHETTVNLLGNGMLALLRHPEQLAMLRDDPARIPTAVEELLRYDSPVQRTIRITNSDVELGGKRIPRHAMVVAAIGAANRDPVQFPDPDRLDVTRRENAHVAFGFGIHFCLGAPLARAEAQIALGTLLRRMPRIALAQESCEWRASTTLRGLNALPVTL